MMKQHNRKGGSPDTEYFSSLSAPAQRALKQAQLDDPHKLAEKTEAEVLSLHGLGPASLPRLRAWLKSFGLSFKGA